MAVRKGILKTLLPSASLGVEWVLRALLCFLILSIRNMNNCLLERTDVILFTSSCQRQVHINTFIILYCLVCRFWLDGWTRNSLHILAKNNFLHICVWVWDFVPEIILFCTHFPTHSPVWIHSCGLTLLNLVYICCEHVSSLKERNQWDAFLLLPLLHVYFWEDNACLLSFNFKMGNDWDKPVYISAWSCMAWEIR